jgi:hypothetical protein
MDQRLDGTNERIGRVENRLERLDGRLDRVDTRLDRVDARLEKIGDTLVYGFVGIAAAIVAAFGAMIGLVATQL